MLTKDPTVFMSNGKEERERELYMLGSHYMDLTLNMGTIVPYSSAHTHALVERDNHATRFTKSVISKLINTRASDPPAAKTHQLPLTLDSSGRSFYENV